MRYAISSPKLHRGVWATDVKPDSNIPRVSIKMGLVEGSEFPLNYATGSVLYDVTEG